jgi:hypothetical protein
MGVEHAVLPCHPPESAPTAGPELKQVIEVIEPESQRVGATGSTATTSTPTDRVAS